MFTNTIDKKQTIIDPNGNAIVDFTPSIYGEYITPINSFNTVKLNEAYQMRADKVSFAEYGNLDGTEFILKYSGITNPFALDSEDVLMIPEFDIAQKHMVDVADVKQDAKIQQVRNYFKYTNKDYKSDSASYDALAKKEIKSGVLDPTESNNYIVPYISEDGRTPITIRGGRMYFGEDNKANDNNIQAVIDSTATALADQCIINGMSLANFVRATTKQ